MLRSSNTLFYSYIPTDIPAAAYTWANANSNITSSSRSQHALLEGIHRLRDWRVQDPFGNLQIPGTSTCSYGPDFTAVNANVRRRRQHLRSRFHGLPQWPRSTITNAGAGYTSAPTVTFSYAHGRLGLPQPPLLQRRDNIQRQGHRHHRHQPRLPDIHRRCQTLTLTGGGYTTKAVAYLQTFTFMNPSDNPKRPRHRFWFGPMTMIQYMMDTGILPGVTTDISMLPAKLGIQGALTDIQNNHPNDLVAMLMFSRPHYSGEPTAAGQFTYPVTSLSNNYTSMINSLWYPAQQQHRPT